MTRLALLMLTVYAGFAFAMRNHACAPRPMNQARTRALVERFRSMPAAAVDGPRVYSCRYVPAYGCDDVTQIELPLKVRTDESAGGAQFNFVYGYPSFFRRAHWFYEHLTPLTLGPGGALLGKGGERRGYVGARGGRLIALLTRARPIDPADRDPVVVPIGDRFEVVTDAFACVPRAWLEVGL